MSLTQIETQLKFINIFLSFYGLENINNLESFSDENTLLKNIDNYLKFYIDLIHEMSRKFEIFKMFHDNNIGTVDYMINILDYMTSCVNDGTHKYEFSITGAFGIIKQENIKIHIHGICSCIWQDEARKKAREHDKYSVCVCSLLKYRDQPITTHVSYGEIKGNYDFSNLDVLHEFIENNEHKDKFAFMEKMTDDEVYQGFFDLDLEKQHLSQNKTDELSTHIIETICSVLNNRIYILCDKSDNSKGIHLYFPEISVNRKQMSEITQNVIDELIKLNFLELSREGNIRSLAYKQIVDKLVCKNGVRSIFQNIKGAHYKINKEKSTYPNIPNDRLGQFKLCSLKKN
jgi:hypothetical protein